MSIRCVGLFALFLSLSVPGAVHAAPERFTCSGPDGMGLEGVFDLATPGPDNMLTVTAPGTDPKVYETRFVKGSWGMEDGLHFFSFMPGQVLSGRIENYYALTGGAPGEGIFHDSAGARHVVECVRSECESCYREVRPSEDCIQRCACPATGVFCGTW